MTKTYSIISHGRAASAGRPDAKSCDAGVSTVKKILFLLILMVMTCSAINCGYSTSSLLPARIKTIHVEPFKNKIDYSSERNRNLYLPLLENSVRNAVIDRFLFDGNLKIAEVDTADLILKGELIDYARDPLRLTDNDDVEEYRIHITVSLVLWDPLHKLELWRESEFIGETTYFVAGTLAKSETKALEDAMTDLARRVVARVIEDW